MFKNLLRLSGLCLAVFVFSIAAQAASPVNTTTFYHLAVDGYDVVAYQTDRKAIKGQSDVRTERSAEHTSELQSLMRNSYAVFCLQKKKLRNSKQQYFSTWHTDK